MDADLVLVLRNSLKGNVESRVSLFSEIIYGKSLGRFGHLEKRKEVIPKAKSR